MLVRIIVAAALAVGSLGAVIAVPASAAHHHKRHHHHRSHHGIPQHNGGDHDADNRGGPSDGDGRT
jgi:hypothetical protein